MSNKAATIVLSNGLCRTVLSWENSVKYSTEKGYRVIARSWPEMEIDIEQIRCDPSPIAPREPREFVSGPPLATTGASAFEELSNGKAVAR